ncbi:MAG: hypothetical protein MJ211_09040 [Bacteroidales bacterium]|nr:hypothetical protein [Bacteroidales bacterium]
MIKNIIIGIIFIIIVVSEIFVLNSNFSLKYELNNQNQYLENITTNLNIYQNQFVENINNSNCYIDTKLVIKDTANCELKLSDIIHDNFLLIRYSDKYCEQCVNHAISVLLDNKECFDFSKIIFLGDFDSKRNFKICNHIYNIIDYQIYNSSELNIPADKLLFPYYIIVDKNLHVLSIYLPNKSTHGTDFDFKNLKYMYDSLIQK